MSAIDRGDSASDPMSRLTAALDHASHLLPAQGPIRVFIHHNTLHAFEDRPFETAVVEAGRKLGCEPFLSEERYRAELDRGRIAEHDLDAVLAADLGNGGDRPIAARVTRRDLRRRILIHGIPEARGIPLTWILDETPVLARFRGDLPHDVRETFLPGEGPPLSTREEEARRVGALWQACLAAIARSEPVPAVPPARLHRHRDLLRAACGVDTDDWIHPVLIRFVAAYLDQGLAHSPMPHREHGMYRCFIDTYGGGLVCGCASWATDLPRAIAEDRPHDRDGLASLYHSLRALAVPEDEWEEFLAQESLALRGWAGMVHQIESRPDRVPTFAVAARLADYLAVRLLLTRSAVAHAARHHARVTGPLTDLRATLATRIPSAAPPTAVDRAWPLFHAAQLCGLDAAEIAALSTEEVAALERELIEFDALARRRLLHLAYEHHLRHRFYDALVGHRPAPPPPAPAFQAIFCIDEREESFRRHLEEVAPEVETFGAAGFFGVAMYFRGSTEAHPSPLCPVAIRPEHYVAETRPDGPGTRASWRRLRDRGAALVNKNIHIGSRTFMRGTFIMATIGVLWVIPLVLRVLFPGLKQRLAGTDAPFPTRKRTRLRLERTAAAPPIGRYTGFTVEEMVEIVRQQLVAIGIVDRFAPLVFVVGHGSTSLNNPHESAHDCGACGGGQGGPNARAFAQMANDPRVRARLAESGLSIPTSTWFIGAQRNTANNQVVFFDADLVPEPLRPSLAQARTAFQAARTGEAHERCRRFGKVPSRLSRRAALLRVQARAADLAQPRPEYGHATNAFCVVGRRARSRGLFLDRRAFLVSYDPSRDPDGAVLAPLLAAIVPVVAGINLEYYFGYVDPTGYGCGTKLPHNVTCLLGVMDGAQSDLRTGLPWQMLEIHEPVRLSLVVEAPRDVLARVLRDDATLRRLVENCWLSLACLDPESHELSEVDGEGFHPYAPDHPLRVARGDSASFYQGKRGHLPFAHLAPAAPEEVRA